MNVQAGLFDAVKADPTSDDAIGDAMKTEFPQYGYSIIRLLIPHWWAREQHRQRCPACLATHECHLDAIYTNSIKHALKTLSERAK